MTGKKEKKFGNQALDLEVYLRGTIYFTIPSHVTAAAVLSQPVCIW